MIPDIFHRQTAVEKALLSWKTAGNRGMQPTATPFHPVPTVVLPPEEDKQWAYVVGSFILHFGSLEYLSFIFIEIFSGTTARDAAMSLTFSKRIKMVKKLIRQSKWTENDKKEALKLWSEVAVKCKFRNEIAHNPFITKVIQGKAIGGILNVRHMRGPGPYTPPLIHISDVVLIHNRIGELVLALNATIKPG
jgi:hypothetical protein